MGKEIVVRRVIVINAPVSRVWEALTESRYTKKYMFGLEVASDWKQGNTIEWKGSSGGGKTFRKGRILSIVPGELLRLSDFNPDAGAEDVEENYAHVTYKLTGHGATTSLSVITDHLNGDEVRRRDSEGFWDRVLPALKELLEASPES